jgi:hypothetical protein
MQSTEAIILFEILFFVTLIGFLIVCLKVKDLKYEIESLIRNTDRVIDDLQRVREDIRKIK